MQKTLKPLILSRITYFMIIQLLRCIVAFHTSGENFHFVLLLPEQLLPHVCTFPNKTCGILQVGQSYESLLLFKTYSKPAWCL